MTDIEIKTRSIYDELSPAEQKVAWYFLQNLGSVFDDPIAVLAEKSGVSQVMWVRFCKSLGFSGLKDMKKNLFFQLSQQRAEASAPSMDFLDTRTYSSVEGIISGVEAGSLEAIRSTAQIQDTAKIETVAAKIAQADCVRLFGVGASGLVASDLYYKLLRVDVDAVFCTDLHVQLTYITGSKPGDVAIFFSNSGRPRYSSWRRRRATAEPASSRLPSTEQTSWPIWRTMCCPPRRRSCSSAAAPQAADWLRSLWWTCSSPRSATRTTPPWPSRWRRAIPSAASTMPDKRGERRMKITGFRIGLVSARLRVPFKTALRTVDSVEDVIVELETSTGQIGRGEAPPTAAITGETLDSIIAALRDHICPKLVGRDISDFEELQSTVQTAIVGNSSAKAAADIALWDLYAQDCGLPLYKLLGGSTPRLETDLTISVNSPDTMAKDAEYGINNGYNVLKTKVGIDPELDLARLRAVRGAAKDARIRIDANQAWTPKQAVRLLNQMQDAGLDIELVEQPVKANDLEGLKFVTTNSPVPVLADESVFTPRNALRIMQERAADMVNIKLMKCGGITNALRIVSAAEVYGVECMMGCMLETKVSVTAAAHLACARKIITRIDLDGPALCTEDPVTGGAMFNGPEITLPDAPGLGISGIENLRYIV